MTDIHLLPLCPEDALMVFKWRNDPTIVRLSSSQREITWIEHQQWIRSSISNPDRQVYIIYKADQAIGQVRFDRMQHTPNAVISVYLLNEFTGRGFGIKAIEIGSEAIFNCWRDVKSVYAFVRSDNEASQSAFMKAGFHTPVKSSLDIKDHKTFILIAHEC